MKVKVDVFGKIILSFQLPTSNFQLKQWQTLKKYAIE